MPYIYEAIYEDLSHLGGPMGTEYTTEHSLGVFDDPQKAKNACQASYKKEGVKTLLKWIKSGENLRTPDLGFVMYHVRIRKIN